MELSQINDQQVQMIMEFADQTALDVARGDWQPKDREKAIGLLLRLQFAPMGDNHHNAKMCPYCSPQGHLQRASMESGNGDAGGFDRQGPRVGF